MNMLERLAASEYSTPAKTAQAWISDFQSLSPRFRSRQRDLLDWLVKAHVNVGGATPAAIESSLARFSASEKQIAYRGHEPDDFTHTRWDEMPLMGLQGSDLSQKMLFFERSALSVFERLYEAPSLAPEMLIHVTCTGYGAPSAAQRLVSARQWGDRTQVLHAYHMGCYAAHPALRMAMGQPTADIVHTELCSLHLNLESHEPAQLVIQSLFADGFIRYRVSSGLAGLGSKAGLEILALKDEIIPDSLEAMGWTPGPFHFEMRLSKEVPFLLAGALPGFAERLFEAAGLDYAAERERTFFAIHPGGPRIIEAAETILDLGPAQVDASRRILRDHGNMSSATLPHIWQDLLHDPNIPEGTLIASLGAGPGLTLSGALFRKHA